MTTVVKHYKSRAAIGKPCTRVLLNGRQVEGRKVRRAMKGQMREAKGPISLIRNQIAIIDGHVLPFTNNL
jgi:hypothetical protein